MAADRRRGVRAWLRPGRGWPCSDRGWLAEISDAIVSVFFPSGCRICDSLLASGSRVPLCEECLLSFERVPKIVCEVCGRPLPGLAQEPEQPLLCPACQDRTYTFDRARSFALYPDAGVRAILLLKFEQIEPVGPWSAERLAEGVTARGPPLPAHAVAPVPPHAPRARARGSDQARRP